jgi:outer membrane protein OmpA-like peptidoglycan-associated protein
MTAPLFAQLKSGFKHLEKRDYPKALSAFQQTMHRGKPAEQTAAWFGAAKAAVNIADENLWAELIATYPEKLEQFGQLPPNEQKELLKEHQITKPGLEQAYSSLFSKAMVAVERKKEPSPLEEVLLDEGTTVPKSHKSRIDRIKKRNDPAPKPELPIIIKEEAAEKPSAKPGPKPEYVERNVPPGSKLIFVKGINTRGSEYLPIVTADGKTMYFVGSSRTDNFRHEDVFYSERQPDGAWGEPKMEVFLSGNQNEAVVSVSADGNTLILFVEGKPHLCQKTLQGWSKPQLIRLQKDYAWIGMASITRNGEALLYEARENYLSDIDVFVALRNKDGSWGAPFSIGAPVNTSNDERTPFLHSDFKTLYFSSNRPGGSGKLDVYKTTRIGEGWTSWTTPENLGTNINTTGDDYGYNITPSGNVAYLSSTLPGYYDQDIMRIPLDQAARPEEQVVISGALKDGSGKPYRGELTVLDAATNERMQTVNTRPDGSYSFSVPKTSKVVYYATGDSLVSSKKTYVDASTYKSEVVEEVVEMVSKAEAESGKAIELKDLLFDFAKSDLRPESMRELDRVFTDIKKFGWKIEVGGHTDNVGSDANNQVLSEQRAKAVHDYLVKLGYAPDKISFKGYGASQPLKDNGTESGRARNRRVEIKVKKEG